LVVLRDSTTDTAWNGQVLPAQATVVIVVILSSFFHRDEQTLPFADHFTPRDMAGRTGAGQSSTDSVQRLPRSLDHFSLRFTVTP
jgi:hypothetical protein